eukprot:3471079-Rhodomonas_salina.2
MCGIAMRSACEGNVRCGAQRAYHCYQDGRGGGGGGHRKRQYHEGRMSDRYCGTTEKAIGHARQDAGTDNVGSGRCWAGWEGC